MKTLLKDIESYWSKRSVSYSDGIKKCLEDDNKKVWINVLLENFPKHEGKEPKILDIGTGPGFFAILLAKAGYDVVAVDYTEEMLKQAASNAKDCKDKITFRQMDAHSLDFDDESFDVIITRNLTWNLERPVDAYTDWHRVLKKGGRMLNFDANWYGYLFDDNKAEHSNVDIDKLYCDYHFYLESDIMESISRQLPLSRYQRPQWDSMILLNIGFSKVLTDTTIYETTWTEEEIALYPDSLGFMIRAEK